MRRTKLDPVAFMLKRFAWRYAKGMPATAKAEVHMGDSREVLRGNLGLVSGSRAQLLFTSPPFHYLTNYHADQWLRLWPLEEGSTGCSTAGHAEAGIRLYSQERYRALLLDVFTSCAAMLAPEARVYVRTTRQPFTYSATREALQRAFPGRRLHEVERPAPPSRSQTRLYQGAACAARSPGEVDLVLV